jgi:hypothetical protein
VSRAVERLAARRVAEVRARVTALLIEEPGVRVQDEPAGLVVVGRGMRGRWLRVPRLRWLGRWA